MKLTATLPIQHCLPQLQQSLVEATRVLLQAPPGAGKTTQVPLALLEAPWRKGKKIIMLEPRRLAARAAARYMAQCLGEQPGQTVGYRTKLDSQISARTQIEVVTEGVLTRLIQSDPQLDDYAAVIFDEFHERSLAGDLGLALVRESQEVLREDLRVLVMSATLETAPLAKLLGDIPVISSQGRAYPVEVVYRPVAKNTTLPLALVRVIQDALAEQQGSILVFLPGMAEIRHLAGLLHEQVPEEVVITPLYGHLKPQEQDVAIAPARAGARKLVLATAIAETSLTIEGVSVVIDSGQQRRSVFDPSSGMSRLVTHKVSKASAKQRKGRAGREQPGVCYRLWSEAEQAALAEFTPPEILAADLAPLVLELARWGARDPEQVSWIDAPPTAHWNQAVELLQRLSLLDQQGALTHSGKAAARLGIHPRLANMVLAGRQLGLGRTAAQLAALLEERDLLGSAAGADMHQRLELVQNERPAARIDTRRFSMVRRAAQRLMLNAKTESPPSADPCCATTTGRLLAFAYPDRLAKQRSGQMGRYQLSNGKGARLLTEDALNGQDWLVAVELDGRAREANIYLAAPIDIRQTEQDLASLITEQEEAFWDEQRGRLVARRVRKLGELVLAEEELAKPAPHLLQAGLLNAVRAQGIHSLPWTKTARQWQARVTLLAKLYPGTWPAVSDADLLQSLDDWLLPYLSGMQRWADLKQLKLTDILNSQLSYSQQQDLARLAPAALRIPTGQTITLDYTAESGPVIAAKLQAFFGWQTTPTIADGQVAVVLHLLSPAQRPLAITADLANFWHEVYPGVRKDLRGRYPKHPWPEDPLTAPAQQGVKR